MSTRTRGEEETGTLAFSGVARVVVFQLGALEVLLGKERDSSMKNLRGWNVSKAGYHLQVYFPDRNSLGWLMQDKR